MMTMDEDGVEGEPNGGEAKNTGASSNALSLYPPLN
jgi:hypothetical protein